MERLPKTSSQKSASSNLNIYIDPTDEYVGFNKACLQLRQGTLPASIPAKQIAWLPRCWSLVGQADRRDGHEDNDFQKGACVHITSAVQRVPLRSLAGYSPSAICLSQTWPPGKRPTRR